MIKHYQIEGGGFGNLDYIVSDELARGAGFYGNETDQVRTLTENTARALGNLLQLLYEKDKLSLKEVAKVIGVSHIEEVIF